MTAFAVLISVGLIGLLAFVLDVVPGTRRSEMCRRQRTPQLWPAHRTYRTRRPRPRPRARTRTTTPPGSARGRRPSRTRRHRRQPVQEPLRFADLAGRLRRHSHRSRARARDRRHAGSTKNLAAIVVIEDLACKTDEDNCFGPDHTKDLDFDGAPGAPAPDSSTSRVTARR